MAGASSSGRSKPEGMRRVLFVGPAGSGKSTLINGFINNDVTEAAMSSPAVTGDTSSGITTAFITYYNFPDNAYTDSIGLGDHRFKPENVMKSLKSVLKNSSVGYNKVYICIQYGRISADTRHYIDLITTIFGDSVLQWCSIIFTHCRDEEMTKEKYLSKNRGDSNITDIIRSVNTVIFGDNMVDQNSDVEIVLRGRRRNFLDRMKKDLDETAKSEYFKLCKQNVAEKMHRVMKMFHGSIDKFSTIVNDVISFANAFADVMPSSNYCNYFGECSICCEDVTDENQPVITQCNHIYHEVCLMQWVGRKNHKDCPICRTKFDDSVQKSFATLTLKK